MKSLLTFLLALGFGLVRLSAQTAASYTTQGFITTPPQIDALVWTNRDTVQIFSFDLEPALAFETQNTERFVNLGKLEISPGIRFETIPSTGERKAAKEFINRGEILSPDFFRLFGSLDDPIHRIFGGRISIWADSITSPGYITGLSAGLIEIRGQDVNLTRGGVGNDVVSARLFLRDSDAMIYNPELGFQDNNWAYGTGDVGFDLVGGDTQPLIFPSPTDPTTTITNFVVGFNGLGFPNTTLGLVGGGSVSSGDYQVFVRKQTLDTNVQVFDIVFARVSDPENILVNVAWSGRAPQGTPPFGNANITLRSIETNVVRGVPAVNAVTFTDSYATSAAEALFQNLLTEITYQPTNMFARRLNVVQESETNDVFFSSGTTNTLTHWIDSDPRFPLTLTNYTPMTNTPLAAVGFCTWSGSMAWLPSISMSENPVRASLTNIGGRVSIDAENLVLSRTRIQGQGGVTIKANNLVSADRVVVDAPILSLDLNKANNDLQIEGIARGSYRRMGGTFRMLSTVISNTFTYTFTNPPADPTQQETTVDANYVAFYHITVLDTDFASLRRQQVEDIRLQSDKVTISDPMPVSRDLLIDAVELVVNNNLERVDIQKIDLTSSEFPRLNRLEITSNGQLHTAGLLETGDSTRTLSTIANFGQMLGAGVRLRVGELDNSGHIEATDGQLDIGARRITGTGGQFWSEYGINLQADEVDISGASIDTFGDILLNVASANFGDSELLVSSQLEVKRIPSAGNFGGLTIAALPLRFQETVIVWPDADLGPNGGGTSGGGYLGELFLGNGDDDSSNQDFNAVRLKGSTSANALYVGLLSFSDDALAAIEDYLFVEPNLTVYFSATSPNIAPEVLDGFITESGGKLVYAPSSSSVGDSIVVRVGVSVDGSSVELSWDANPSGAYRVESRSLNGGTWTNVGTLKNSGAKSARLKLDDSIGASSGRLYRVIKAN
jgi:hypothetical protein